MYCYFNETKDNIKKDNREVKSILRTIVLNINCLRFIEFVALMVVSFQSGNKF